MTTPESEQPQAISTEEASRIATRVRRLIKSGDEESAWEQLRRLHPADIGSILASLPSSGRTAMFRVMSPGAVIRVLERMNPLEAARVATRLGSRMLARGLSQLNPMEAVSLLQRLPLPLRQTREVVEELERPPEEAELVSYAPGTAGAIMVSQFPTVGLNDLTRDRLGQSAGTGPRSLQVHRRFRCWMRRAIWPAR